MGFRGGIILKKGQEYIGIVERVDFPNKGIVNVDGEYAIVKNSIMGQKIRFGVNKSRGGKVEGRLLEVLKDSELETLSPACPDFGLCGGCNFQTLPYETQLTMKASQVRRLMDGVIIGEYAFDDIQGSPLVFGYRNKMEFSFGDEVKGGPLALGLHKRGSIYDIVSVSDCQIVHADYNCILKCVLDFCTEKELTFFHRMTHQGYLRHLLVRRAEKTGEILINLITSSQVECAEEIGDLQEFVNRLVALELSGEIVGILHTVNDSVADVVQSDRTDSLYGQDFFYEEVLGLKFKISTFSFFQTNSLGAEVLYSSVREFVGDTKDKLIFDLYSGTGTIAQLLAPVAKKIVGVEIVEEAVLAARENAKLNGLKNCEFIVGDVLKVIDSIVDKPDLIVLDPPRDGIHPKALKKIIEFGVERLVYISCKPTSLVRDLVELQGSGYGVERVRCVDLFPGTTHVETCVLLSHKKPDSYINVKVEFGEGEGKVPLDKIVERAERENYL